jgi:hypothetical protein
MTNASATWATDAEGVGAYAEVNGINLYHETLPEHRLAILPGVTHYNSFMSPLLPVVVIPFLAQAA